MNFAHINNIRRRLGMSYQQLARRSGVSQPTVQRILSGKHPQASFANISAIATALGLEIFVEPDVDAATLRRRQAEEKAKRLVALVQGTSGLEAQAVEAKVIQEMIEQTAVELLRGSNRRLWGEM